MSPREFTMTMLRYNEPIVFRLLADPKDEVQAKLASLSELEERLRRLEAQLVD